jgi:hypothetical protein
MEFKIALAKDLTIILISGIILLIVGLKKTGSRLSLKGLENFCNAMCVILGEIIIIACILLFFVAINTPS